MTYQFLLYNNLNSLKFSDFNFKEYDEHKFSLIHYILSLHKTDKLYEYLNLDLPLEITSDNNKIPNNFFILKQSEKNNKCEINLEQNIKIIQDYQSYYFEKLNILDFLFLIILFYKNTSTKGSHIEQSNLYKITLSHLQMILEKDHKLLYTINSKGYSFTDYVFLNFNVDILKIIAKYDSSFSSLSKIDNLKAFSIIDLELKKIDFLKTQQISYFFENMSQPFLNQIYEYFKNKIDYNNILNKIKTNENLSKIIKI